MLLTTDGLLLSSMRTTFSPLANEKLSTRLENLISELSTVSPEDSIATLLDEFLKKREHIFLVVDEYGTTQGIITLEDAVETLLGAEIVDESDSVEDMRQLARELWEKRRKRKTNLKFD